MFANVMEIFHLMGDLGKKDWSLKNKGQNPIKERLFSFFLIFFALPFFEIFFKDSKCDFGIQKKSELELDLVLKC